MKEPGKKYNDEDNMLVNDLRSIVSKARSKAFAAVNYSLVERNWRIGQRIVEQEQNGASRAEYGKHVIEVASAALTKEFGKGFSETNIKSYRRFYNFFPDLGIGQAVPAQLEKQKQQAVPAIFTALVKEEYQTHFTNLNILPWTHYERLIRVEDKQAREWYAKEAFNEGWSYRTLNRNINTLYYERLLMSTKKQPVVDEMQDKTKAYQQDKLEYIKSPVVLEFLGLPEDTSLAESKLETAIINNLEKFLMEMGKGYGSSATYPNRGKRLLHRSGILQLPHQIIYFGRFEGKSHHLPGCRTDGYVSSDVRQDEKRTRRQPYNRHHPLYRNRFGCGTILYPRQKRPDVRSKIQALPTRQGRLEKRNRTTEGTVSNGSS